MQIKTHTFIEFLASHSLLIKALDYLKWEGDDSVYMYFGIGATAILKIILHTPSSLVDNWRVIYKDTTQ